MKFWDSSAIIPLILEEKSSEKVKKIALEDEDIVVWWTTIVECRSALARRKRENHTNIEDENLAVTILNSVSSVWSEVLPNEKIRNRAERLLSVHPLRTSDAFQLAAALQWAKEEPKSHAVVCLDFRLREAAQKEGFSVLPLIK